MFWRQWEKVCRCMGNERLGKTPQSGCLIHILGAQHLCLRKAQHYFRCDQKMLGMRAVCPRRKPQPQSTFHRLTQRGIPWWVCSGNSKKQPITRAHKAARAPAATKTFRIRLLNLPSRGWRQVRGKDYGLRKKVFQKEGIFTKPLPVWKHPVKAPDPESWSPWRQQNQVGTAKTLNWHGSFPLFSF